jgi:hypothetical protein
VEGHGDRLCLRRTNPDGDDPPGPGLAQKDDRRAGNRIETDGRQLDGDEVVEGRGLPR